MKPLKLLLSFIFTLLFIIKLVDSQGYEAYSGGGSNLPQFDINNENETNIATNETINNTNSIKAPLIPFEPPRSYIDTDIMDSSIMSMNKNDASSLSYRPPPPPLRREAESLGKCKFGN